MSKYAEDKGEKNGSCNRYACQKPGATWYNHSTRKYYCTACAEMINDANKAESLKMYGHALCMEDSPEKEAEDALRYVNQGLKKLYSAKGGIERADGLNPEGITEAINILEGVSLGINLFIVQEREKNDETGESD